MSGGELNWYAMLFADRFRSDCSLFKAEPKSWHKHTEMTVAQNGRLVDSPQRSQSAGLDKWTIQKVLKFAKTDEKL